MLACVTKTYSLAYARDGRALWGQFPRGHGKYGYGRLVGKSPYSMQCRSNRGVGDPPLDFRYESPISYLLGGAVEEVVYANAEEPYVFNKMPNKQNHAMSVWVKTIIVKDTTFQYRTTPVFDVYFITDQVRMGTLFQLPRWLSDFELDNPRPRFIRATPITYLDQDNMIQTLTRSTYLETVSRGMYNRTIAKGALSKKEFDVIADFFRSYLMEVSELIISNPYNDLTKKEELISVLKEPLTGHIYSQLRINNAIEDLAPLVKRKYGVVGAPTLVKSDDKIKTTDKEDTINIMEKSDNKNELPCANCINEMLKNHDLGLSDEQRLAVVGLMAMALNMKPEKED